MSDVSCSSLLSLSDGMDQNHSSQTSELYSSDDDFKDICRICHSEEQNDSPLISPCSCLGSLCYVHNSCLQEWIKSSGTNCCEICKFQFIMETKLLTFWKWNKLKMTLIEKLLLVLSFPFHALMIPSLVYLFLMAEKIDADQRRLLNSVQVYNWTLKIIIGIGLFIESIFIVCQCKLFVQLFRMWRNCNRIIYVQNAPKIGAMVQKKQQHADEFLAFSQLPPTNELTIAHSNCFAPKESKFYGSPSDRNIHTSDRYCVEFCDEKNTSGEITNTKMRSIETSLTSNCDLTLGEVVVVSSAADVISKTIADKIQTTDSESRKISLIAKTDNAPVPIVNHKYPMNEFVETSTACGPFEGKLKKNIYHFFSGGHRKIHAEDKDFLLPQKGNS